VGTVVIVLMICETADDVAIRVADGASFLATRDAEGDNAQEAGGFVCEVVNESFVLGIECDGEHLVTPLFDGRLQRPVVR
jgi:hypothetical protein